MKAKSPLNKPSVRNRPKSAGSKHPGSSAFFSRNDSIWAVVMFILGFALYANTIPNKYLMDDYSVLSENFVVKRGLEGIPTILQTPYRYGYGLLSDNLYRPLSQVMFATEWQIAPDSPALSHFFNVLFYAFTCALLFLVFRKILPRKIPMLPVLATLLWLFHPIHTEVVANIKSRDEIMATFFLFLTILAFVAYVDRNRPIYLAGALVAYLLGFFSKEGIVTFLAVFPLIGWYFLKGPAKRYLLASALLVIPALVYLLVRHQVLSSYATPEGLTVADNLLVGAPDILTRLATAIMLLGKYLLLLLVPYQLVCDYSYNQIPLVGWGNPLVWASFLSCAGALVYAFMNIRKRSVIVFGVLLFFITMSIYSNIFMLIGTSFGERLLFLPSVGFCLLLAVALLHILGKPAPDQPQAGMKEMFSNQRVTWLVAGVILILFSLKTLARNAEWKDRWTLTTADVKRSPRSAKMRSYTGMAYRDNAKESADKQQYDTLMKQAISEFRESVNILPSYAEGYEQLGLAYYRMKNPAEAIRNYEKALQLNPGNPVTYSNLGIIYIENSDLPKAVEVYKKSIAMDKNFEDGYINLGNTYGVMGQFDLAAENLKEAIRINSRNARSHYFLGITYQNLHQPDLAREQLDLAGQLDPAFKK